MQLLFQHLSLNIATREPGYGPVCPLFIFGERVDAQHPCSEMRSICYLLGSHCVCHLTFDPWVKRYIVVVHAHRRKARAKSGSSRIPRKLGHSRRRDLILVDQVSVERKCLYARRSGKVQLKIIVHQMAIATPACQQRLEVICRPITVTRHKCRPIESLAGPCEELSHCSEIIPCLRHCEWLLVLLLESRLLMWIIEQILPIGHRKDVRLKRKAIDLKAMACNCIYIDWLCHVWIVQVCLRWIIYCRIIENLGNKILQVWLRN